MFRRHRGAVSRFRLVLVVLCHSGPGGPGLAADTGPLPANNWNLENLEKIKASAAKPLTFAVFGR